MQEFRSCQIRQGELVFRRITESFGLQGALKIINPPAMGREPSTRVAQSPIQSSVEHLQGWGDHKLSRQYFTSKWKCKAFSEPLITKQKLQAYHQKWALNQFSQSGQNKAYLLRIPLRCFFSAHNIAGFLCQRFCSLQPGEEILISSQTLANFTVRVGEAA